MKPVSPRFPCLEKRLGQLAWALALATLAACSDDSQPPPSRDSGGDWAAAREGGLDQRTGADRGSPGTLPQVPQQSGVVYVSHYHSSDLRWYRIDGEVPRAAGSLELGEGRATHDMDLDPTHDRLFIVSDAARTLDIFQLQRPSDPNAPVAAPQLLSSLTLEILPLFVKVDPLRERAYVVAIPEADEVENFVLAVYDVSSPASPQQLAGSPFTIPTSYTVALDYARQVLFLVNENDDTLHAYDLHGDRPTPLPGEPLDLAALYPEEKTCSPFGRAS